MDSTSSAQKKNNPKGLGKGINILIPNISEGSDDEGVIKLGINEIEPNRGQPRRIFDDEALKELSDSISEHGIIQPIIVRKDDGYYEIVAGERRWRAARMAGLSEVPVIVREYGQRELLEVALIENLQREDLSATEEAAAYKRLRDEFNLTQEAIAERVGKNRSTVANSLRLLNLPENVLNLLDSGEITVGHAKALLSAENNEIINEAVKRISEQDLNVRQTEEMMKVLTDNSSDEKPKSKKPLLSPAYKRIEKEISSILGTRVRLFPGKNKSKMEIDYFSDEDLSRLFELIKKLED